MKNDCKIVQDLLPTYIDKLTSNETIDYIEKHLNSCEKCKIIYDNMQQDLKKEEIDDIELGKI